jgi:hypothetical protein
MAALLSGQTKPLKSVAGTVTGFKVDAHTRAILVKSDQGDVSTIPFAPETEVVRVAPGERDLKKAEPARITEIVTSDRVLVSFVEGMTNARRIVLVTATDIAKRNEASRRRSVRSASTRIRSRQSTTGPDSDASKSSPNPAPIRSVVRPWRSTTISRSTPATHYSPRRRHPTRRNCTG